MKSNKVDIEIEVATFLVNVYVLFLCDKNHEMSNTSHHHHLLSVTCHGSSRVTCHSCTCGAWGHSSSGWLRKFSPSSNLRMDTISYQSSSILTSIHNLQYSEKASTVQGVPPCWMLVKLGCLSVKTFFRLLTKRGFWQASKLLRPCLNVEMPV